MCCVGNCSNCCVGNCGDCGNKAAMELKAKHEKEVANELAEMRREQKKEGEVLEKDLLEYAEGAYVELLQVLEQVNKKDYKGKKLNINIERLREEQEKLRKNVVGSMGNLFDELLQPKSPEMAVIIRENNADKRNSMYKEYINKIKLKSRNGLKAKIERNIEKQKEIIFKEINNRLEEINSDLKRAEKAYTEVLAIDKNNRKELEGIQAKNQYQYEIYNVLKDEINN